MKDDYWLKCGQVYMGHSSEIVYKERILSRLKNRKVVKWNHRRRTKDLKTF